MYIILVCKSLILNSLKGTFRRPHMIPGVVYENVVVIFFSGQAFHVWIYLNAHNLKYNSPHTYGFVYRTSVFWAVGCDDGYTRIYRVTEYYLLGFINGSQNVRAFTIYNGLLLL